MPRNPERTRSDSGKLFSSRSSARNGGLTAEKNRFLKRVEKREEIIDGESRKLREKRRGAVCDNDSSGSIEELEKMDKLFSKLNENEQNVIATKIALRNMRLLTEFTKRRDVIFGEVEVFFRTVSGEELQRDAGENLGDVAFMHALDETINSKKRETKFQNEFDKVNEGLSKKVVKAQESGLRAVAGEMPSPKESALGKKKIEGEVLTGLEKEFVLTEMDRQLKIQLIRKEIMNIEDRMGIPKSRILTLRERLRKINQPVEDTPGFRNVIAKTAVNCVAIKDTKLWPRFLSVYAKEMELFSISHNGDVGKDTIDRMEELAITRAVEDTVLSSDETALEYKLQTLKIEKRLINALAGAKDIALGVIEEMTVFEDINKKSRSKR